MSIQREVFHSQASESTKLHALYCYFFLRKTKAEIAVIFGKSPTSITNWVNRYLEEGHLARRDTENLFRKFNIEKRERLASLYLNRPTMYLEEAKYAFTQYWNQEISVGTILAILHERSITYKVIERRAINIKESDIARFVLEINSLDWSQDNILFLDEVSFDNRGMLRKRGYGIKGKRLVVRGEFKRMPRISLLCFINVTGLIESFMVDGTFNRLKFIDCIRTLVKSGKIQKYPGSNSIWILDGARIHCHSEIIYYLRSCGIIPIFYLPIVPSSIQLK
jgi:transposase